MTPSQKTQNGKNSRIYLKMIVSTIFFVLLSTFNVFSNTPRLPVKKGATQRYNHELPNDTSSTGDWLDFDESISDLGLINDSIGIDTISDFTLASDPNSEIEEWVEREVTFNPNPTKAVWLSALFPGLGQIYNRRYWKLPIVAGGFMGLSYATTWNNGMLKDYSQAYADIMDSDPATNSYMDFFPNTTQESSLDKTWLTNVLKSRKDYYRRNRDLCIICMVGVYLVAMVDAYVDASLSHFDISPDLSLDVAPAIFKDSHDRLPSVGVQWAINF